MKTHLLFMGTMLALFISQSLTAQLHDYDLNSYKTPDYKRLSLQVGFNLSENGTLERYKGDSLNYYDNSSFFDAKGNINIFGSNIFNSRAQVKSTSGELVSHFSSSNTSGDMNTNLEWASSSFNRYLLSRATMKTSTYNFYDTNHEKFWYYSVNGGFTGTTSTKGFENDTTTTAIESGYNDNTLDMGFEIGLGNGRFESIDNVVEAIYILKELSEKGILNREIDESSINELADKITVLEQRRYFDIRLYKREFFEDLTAFMLENDYVQRDSVQLFNAINDFHFLVSDNYRQTGKQLRFVLGPNAKYNKYYYLEESGEDYNSSSLEARANLNLNYEVKSAINLKWQKAWSVDLYYYSSSKANQSNEQDWTDFESRYRILRSTLNYSYAYYPNTRTQIKSNVYCNLYWNNILEINDAKYGETNGSVGLDLEASYYFSERLRLRGNLNFNGFQSDDNKQYYSTNRYLVDFNKINLSHSFKLAMSYYLF